MTTAVAAELPQATQTLRLRITEIFVSLQGESTLVGWPTVFIRLTGCPLRCGYCDTAYAFTGGSLMSLDEILAQVRSYKVTHVCVTGGEPLAQKNCGGLLQNLCDAGFVVSLETSGALDISAVDARVIRVVDIKTPGSGESDKNLWTNLDQLKKTDQVKFVICDRADYEWSCDILDKYQINQKCTVLFSPCYETLEARSLADWIVQDRLAVRMQMQMHKLLWGGAPGR